MSQSVTTQAMGTGFADRGARAWLRNLVVLLLVVLPAVVLGLHIASSWFLCDDAFISFRYARHLLDGHGLVFNPGERVEGYTNLLWVLEIAGLWGVGLRPEWAAPLLSVALTAGTLWVVGVAAARLAAPGRAAMAAWVAVTLVATSQAFAEWSTSGLETRQFTFLVVLGLHALSRAAGSSRWCLVASLVFAAAELTRPEGLLVFVCASACWGAHALAQRETAMELRVRRSLLLFVPFATIVALHFLWRHGYYGEWLPNTYHAKHVRAWYESGWRYVAAASLELGMWVWMPLAAAAVCGDRRRRFLRLLPFAVVLPHLGYLMHIGGDHFAFRPLDFYLPVLAPLAAATLLRLLPDRRWLVVSLLPILVYAHGMGVAHDWVARRSTGRERTAQMNVQIAADAPPWLRWLPGMPTLAAWLDGLRTVLSRHAVAAPVWEHAELGRELMAGYAAYESLPPGTFGADTVTAIGAVGVMPFYLRDLRVVDTLGLTDAVVARNPSAAENAWRVMAHDRRPPPGYLRQRGANLYVQPRRGSADEALAIATFALRVDEGTWMPLLATDLADPPRRWSPSLLAARHSVDVETASNNRITIQGATYLGTRLLATFEPEDRGLAWRTSGAAGIAPLPEQVFGAVGAQVLGTATGPERAHEVGHASSSPFEPAADSVLLLFVAGHSAPGVSLRLLRGSTVLHTWSQFRSTQMAPLGLPIGAFAGQSLHLELHDDGAGWLAIDHVLLAREAVGAAAVGRPWAPSGHATRQAFESVLTIEPLTSRRGLAVAGEAEVTFRNPFAAAAQVSLTPVSRSACADLRIGAWTVAGQLVDSVPAGGEGRCRLVLEVHEAVPAHEAWFSLDVQVSAAGDAAGAAPRFTATVALPWRASD